MSEFLKHSESTMGRRKHEIVMRDPEIVLLADHLPEERAKSLAERGRTHGVKHRRKWESKISAARLLLFVRRPDRGEFRDCEGMFDGITIREEDGLYSDVLWLAPEEENNSHTYVDTDLRLLVELQGGPGE